MQLDSFMVEAHPDPKDVQALVDHLTQFNLSTTQIPFSGEVAIFVRAEEDQMVAGVWGWVWGACLEIRILWVHESLRGQGYGTRLLQAAEQEGRARGAKLVCLDTHSFQAPGFYLKMGYDVVGVLDGYPEGHKKYFFRKTL